jgi:hypothetical protein
MGVPIRRINSAGLLGRREEEKKIKSKCGIKINK